MRRTLLTLATTTALAGLLSVGLVSPAQAADTGTISGVVTGDVAAGWDSLATVRVNPTSGPAVDVPIDSAGNYTVTLPVGSYRLTFLYTGAANFVGNFHGGTTRPYVDVAAAATVNIDAVLEVGGSISGQITGSTGPVPQPTVSAQATGPNGTFSSRKTVASNGEFTIDRLPAGTIRFLFTSLTGNWVGQRPLIDLGAQEVRTGLDIVLDPKTSLAVYPVIAGTGYSAFDVAVDLFRDGTLVGTKFVQMVGPAYFDQLAPGPYTVCVRESNPSAELDPGVVEVEAEEWQRECWQDIAPGGTATPVTLALGDHGDVRPQLVRNVEISGSINGAVNYQQVPLVGAEIELLREEPAGSGTYVTVATAVGSHYKFLNVPPGRYLVRASDGARSWFEPAFWPGYPDQADATSILVDSYRDVTVHAFTLEGGEFSTTRLAGASRFETGVAVSGTQFPGTPGSSDHPSNPVPVIYVANGLNYPDALSAGPAAIVQNGGILLIRPDAIPNAVQTELRRLEPERIVVVGGTASISAAVFAQLQEFSDSVDRIGGSNRYETSNLIVRDAFEGRSVSDVLLATGRNFPDALAAGPAAGSVGAPVILIDGGPGTLAGGASDLIADLGANRGWVIGGANSVSPEVEASLRTMLTVVTRVEGPDRYGTATDLNLQFFDEGTDDAILATGASFADALAAGPLAGALDAPIYLSTPTCVPHGVVWGLVISNVRKVTLLGGTPSLNADVAQLKICP